MEEQRHMLLEWLGKTKTAARRVVSAYLKELREQDRITADVRLQALASFHPNRRFPSNVVFVLKRSPPYFKPALHVEAKNGGYVDFSWIKCVENLYGGYDKEKNARLNKLAALRNEAFKSDAMQTARASLGDACERCKEKCPKLVLDHADKPFAQIVDEFLGEHSLSLSELKIRGSRNDGFHLRRFGKQWREFHDKNAVLGLPAYKRMRVYDSVYMQQTLSELNRNFEASVCDPSPDIWHEWLWECDLAEPLTVDCLLNRAHLLGLLIARYRALKAPESMEVVVSLPHMVHRSSKVSAMTPRQLKDVIEDLQLHWSVYSEKVDVDELTCLVDACMTRLGHFNLYPSKYDDVTMCDANATDRMNVLCIRRLISILCILYRHLDLLHRWVDPPVSGRSDDMEPIQAFHVQSSMDEYHKHIMHSDLPPAALLLYRQDFAGFYHCISQVVYFHFPSYERKPQLDVERIKETGSAVNALSPVMEMYPEINLCYEDGYPKKNSWNWILMGKRVYLMDQNHDLVYYSTDLFQMMAVYLNQDGALIRNSGP